MKIDLTELDDDLDLRKNKEKRKIKNSFQDLETERILFPFGGLAVAVGRTDLGLVIKSSDVDTINRISVEISSWKLEK